MNARFAEKNKSFFLFNGVPKEMYRKLGAYQFDIRPEKN